MLQIFIAMPLHLKRDSAVLPPMWSGVGVGVGVGARLISHLIIELFVPFCLTQQQPPTHFHSGDVEKLVLHASRIQVKNGYLGSLCIPQEAGLWRALKVLTGGTRVYLEQLIIEITRILLVNPMSNIYSCILIKFKSNSS